MSPTAACQITRIDYAEDEGSIVCHISQEGDDQIRNVVVTFITHLDFDPGHPLTREIAAYQKHRINRLNRSQHAPHVEFG